MPLRESPRRGDRRIPKSVTKMASTHSGHSVAVTDTGCVPIASVLPADACDDEVTRQTSIPSPLPVPKYAPTAFIRPSGTKASELGLHETGPTDTGTEGGEDIAWKRATFRGLGALRFRGASGPAGDTAHATVAASTPPPSVGQRLSAKVKGAATSESETAREPASPLSLETEDADEKSSAYGWRDVLGVHV